MMKKMKKLNIFLTCLALCGMGLTSCDLEQELPPVSYPDGGSAETFGNGDWDNPYHVWQILLGTENGTDAEGYTRATVWATGYIVGYISTANGSAFNEGSAKFMATGAEATNLLLAETPDETDWEKCAPVQLPSGAVRNALNLADHPENLGKEVSLKGSLEKYFGAYGIKSLTAYEWGSEGVYTPDEPGGGGGSGAGSVTGTSYLVSNMNDFTVDNVNLPSGLNYVWSWDSYNYAKGSAYLGGNYAAESYLISPQITLDATAPAATFSQAINYLNGNNVADFLNVCVREGSSGDWTVVNVSTWPAGTGWTFYDGCAIDLSAFAGKTVQIAFHYKSTSSCAPTWEVKNLVVGTAK